MATAVNNDEQFADDGTRGGGTKIRDYVTLKKPLPQQNFEPSFGEARTSYSQPPTRLLVHEPLSQPLHFAHGLPRDPRQLQEAKSKLNDTGTVYEPEPEVPRHPEVRRSIIMGEAPAIGTLVTIIPAFAQELYGMNSPTMEVGDPLALHGKDANNTPAQPVTKIDAPPPPLGFRSSVTPTTPIPPVATSDDALPYPTESRSAPPPRSVTPPTAVAPMAPPHVIAPPAPVPAPDVESRQQQQQEQQPQPQPQPPLEVPKNAKKVVTTTTTTTKIVDGKEVVETHIHHDVVLKRRSLIGMPKFLKKSMRKKKTTTTTSTTSTRNLEVPS